MYVVADGSIIIPALPVSVVDETGAGNSYCGGFVVGYERTGGEPDRLRLPWLRWR